MARPKVNNNPFALMQKRPDKWKGLTGKHPDGFLTFSDLYFGSRAGFISLINTYLKKGLTTTAQIIPKYAPLGHGQNNPELYIRALESGGFPRSQEITPENLYKLGKLIVAVEEGTFFVPEHIFKKAYNTALVDTKTVSKEFVIEAKKKNKNWLFYAGLAALAFYFIPKK